MKLYTEQGKLVKTLIESGDLDADLAVLQKLIARQLRNNPSMSWCLLDKDKGGYPTGSKVKVKTDISLRYMPQYMRGAILEVQREERDDFRGNEIVSYEFKILHLKYKPRGGFGEPPRFVPDGSFRHMWFCQNEVELYVEEQELEAIQKDMDKIRKKHERTE